MAGHVSLVDRLGTEGAADTKSRRGSRCSDFTEQIQHGLHNSFNMEDLYAERVTAERQTRASNGIPTCCMRGTLDQVERSCGRTTE